MSNLTSDLTLPIKNWSMPLKIGNVASDRRRPPQEVGLELRRYHLGRPVASPEFRRFAGNEPRRNQVCQTVCTPRDLGWSEGPDFR